MVISLKENRTNQKKAGAKTQRLPEGLEILDLESEAEKAKLPNRKRQTRKVDENRIKNKEYFRITYMFAAVFACMILFFVYFNTFKSEDVINSPYNSRQDTFADRVIRGEIYSADGELLAVTDTDEDGVEIRRYPYSNMFAHVIGYDTHGKTGVESIANFHLLTSHAFFGERVMKE